MLKHLTKGDVIQTKLGDAVIERVGPVQRSDHAKFAWAMLTLDLNGQVVYCVAREDELASSD